MTKGIVIGLWEQDNRLLRRAVCSKQTFRPTERQIDRKIVTMTDRMRERESKVTYVAGDEVTEFAMVPFNLGQVHLISIAKWQYASGRFIASFVRLSIWQVGFKGLNTKEKCTDTENITFSQLSTQHYLIMSS